MRYTCQVIFVASFVIFFAGVLDGVHVTGLTLPWVASAPYGACRRGRRPRTNWRSRSKRQFTASGRPPTARRSTPSTTPKVELPQVPLRRRDLRPPPGCGKGARARLGALATEIARKRASCPYALRLVVRCACEAMFYGMQLARISQYAVESHGTPVGESTKTHPGTGRSTRYYLEGRSEVTMKVQVLQEKAPKGGQGAPRP